tara:strand:+ start:10482 stop:11573 length:1092 start_codon:yes stop_codon:yes gene_type:complete
MKTLIYSAAALSLTSFALANDSDWSAFDLEAEALASSLQDDNTTPSITGFIDTYFNNTGDNLPTPGGAGAPGAAADTQGFTVPNARVRMNGSNTGYGYNVEYDFVGARLLDANVSFMLGDINATMGAFRAPLSASGLRDTEDVFFVNRSIIGNATSARQAGAMLNGVFDGKLNWAVAVQNGVDGTVDEHLISARGTYDFMGDGHGADSTEGSYGGTDDMNGTVGVSFADDGGVMGAGLGGGFFGVDATVSTGQYWVSLEIADFEAGYTGTGSEGAGLNAITGAADQSPMVLAGGWMLTPDEWELGLRYTDTDNGAADTTMIDIAANHYNNGHDVKWTIQFTQIDSDPGGPDGSAISAGVTVSF